MHSESSKLIDNSSENQKTSKLQEITKFLQGNPHIVTTVASIIAINSSLTYYYSSKNSANEITDNTAGQYAFIISTIFGNLAEKTVAHLKIFNGLVEKYAKETEQPKDNIEKLFVFLSAVIGVCMSVLNYNLSSNKNENDLQRIITIASCSTMPLSMSFGVQNALNFFRNVYNSQTSHNEANNEAPLIENQVTNENIYDKLKNPYSISTLLMLTTTGIGICIDTFLSTQKLTNNAAWGTYFLAPLMATFTWLGFEGITIFTAFNIEGDIKKIKDNFNWDRSNAIKLALSLIILGSGTTGYLTNNNAYRAYNEIAGKVMGFVALASIGILHSCLALQVFSELEKMFTEKLDSNHTENNAPEEITSENKNTKTSKRNSASLFLGDPAKKPSATAVGYDYDYDPDHEAIRRHSSIQND